MSTKRRIGVSIASTEAARRQLMQPVPCWEKVWVTPSFGSSLKAYKWVKTEKVQIFDDEEGDADEPLAPLPDEHEVVEVDEEEGEGAVLEATQAAKDINMDVNPSERPSEVPQSPKAPTLTLTQENSELDVTDPTVGMDSGPMLTLEPTMDGTEDLEDEAKKAALADRLSLDISGLGPDGLQLEGAHDLSQLDGPDSLMGGPLMDQSADPFAEGS